MGLLDLFRRDAQEQTEQLPEVTPPVDDVLLRALLNNETITRKKALTIPAVAGAVDFIGNIVASMPIKLFRYRDGKVEEIEKDTRVSFLNGDTGDTLDAFQMKKAMVEDYLMGKGGYCYIRKSMNEVTGLYYVSDEYIEIWKSYEPIFKDYKILVMGKEYKPYEFIKLLRNTKDGASGVGLTVEVSKALETAYQTLLYQLGMVRSGGNKKGFLKASRKLGQEEINILKKAWRNLYGNNEENVVVLNNGLEFQEASSSSVEMQMNESKRTLQDEINDLFHIHPNDFYLTFKLAIYPIIKAFETALNSSLLLENEKKNRFFEFDVKEIIKANVKERFEAYKIAKETGFMTINEMRKEENMNWIEGMDVVNVGLGAVLYDIDKHVYYTPNTDTVSSMDDTQSADEKTQEMLEDHEMVEEFDESGNSSEVRFNKNHDGKTGRFTSSKGGSGGFVSADEKTQKKHQDAIAKLDEKDDNGNDRYEDGTYNLDSLTPENYPNGYSVTFCQIGDNYSNSEYADKVNEFLSVSSDGKTLAGKFEGTPEVSFHVKDVKKAMELAKKYNQKSIWDWEKGETIDTGGTGRRNNRFIEERDMDILIKQFQEKYPTKAEKEKALSEMTNDQINELISVSDNVFQKIFFSQFRKEERFNPNHDGKTGRFAPKSGGGGGLASVLTADGKIDKDALAKLPVSEQVALETDWVKTQLSNNVKPFEKEASVNMGKVKDRGNLTDAEAKQCVALADKVYDKASKEEPQITNDVVSSVAGASGQMYGLDYRLKQPTSLAGKIGEDSKTDGVSFDSASSNIKDAVRYTAVLDDANFTDGYGKIKGSLESKGYTEVRCKNFYQGYEDGKQCQKAVQCVYENPDGYKFELQFHTANSQGAKELNHPLYEEFREKTTSNERKDVLFDQMVENGKYVKNPKGVMGIKSHN